MCACFGIIRAMTDNIQSLADTPQEYRGGVRRSQARWLLIVGLALFALFQIVGGLIPNAGFFSDQNFAFDLRMRRNEVRCAHQGVNSFRIWTHEITIPGFTPLGRPDKEAVPSSPGDAIVHAYSPWHIALFYFYGWMPEVMCLSLMALVFGVCLFFVGSEAFRLSKARFGHYGLVVAFSLAMISCSAAHCFVFLNYGVLILAAFLLMNKMLEDDVGWGGEILAGLAWSVMMIKPQVGLLFGWPLFWKRRYLAIAMAIVVCLAETLFVSFAVHEPVIDLILQVPQLGLPYGTGTLARALKPVLGVYSTIVVMLSFFALTGLATFAVRRSHDFLLCCAPAIVAIPLWTYSSGFDHVILLPVVMLLAGRMFATRGIDRWKLLGCSYLLAQIPLRLWSIASSLKLFSPAGIGWMYRLVELFAQLLLVTFVALMIREELQRRRHAG